MSSRNHELPQSKSHAAVVMSAAEASEPKLKCRARLRVFGTYLAVVAAANLIWEVLQLPLYTIWTTADARQQAFAVIHCTVGDVLIACSALAIALPIGSGRAWPDDHYWRVAALAIGMGLGYTIFSEWFNVEVRRSWAYAPAMPVLPLLGTGLGPLLQWIVIPPLALAAAYRPWRTKS